MQEVFPGAERQLSGTMGIVQVERLQGWQPKGAEECCRIQGPGWSEGFGRNGILTVPGGGPYIPPGLCLWSNLRDVKSIY
jgi:hypothetical protein